MPFISFAAALAVMQSSLGSEQTWACQEECDSARSDDDGDVSLLQTVIQHVRTEVREDEARGGRKVVAKLSARPPGHEQTRATVNRTANLLHGVRGVEKLGLGLVNRSATEDDAALLHKGLQELQVPADMVLNESADAAEANSLIDTEGDDTLRKAELPEVKQSITQAPALWQAGLTVVHKKRSEQSLIELFEEATKNASSRTSLWQAAQEIADQALHTWNFQLRLEVLLYGLLVYIISTASVCAKCRVSQVRAWTQAVVQPLKERTGQTPEEEILESLQVRFDDAASRVVSLGMLGIMSTSFKMSLSLYGLYKQAKCGDARGRQPFFWRVRARANWNAWAAMDGISAQEAMRTYISLVTFICEGRDANAKYIALVDEMHACKKGIAKGLHGYGIGKGSSPQSLFDVNLDGEGTAVGAGFKPYVGTRSYTLGD